MSWGQAKGWGKSIDRVDDADQEYRQACQKFGADSPQAQAADQKADAEEARHMSQHYKPYFRY